MLWFADFFKNIESLLYYAIERRISAVHTVLKFLNGHAHRIERSQAAEPQSV